jgi:Methylamine utilisation protein MauE
MTVAALLCRYVLAAMFLHAGLVKLADVGEFRLAVRNYRLVPERALGLVAVGLPVAEAACGLLLAAGLATGPVAAVLVALLTVFVVAIAVNLRRGRTFSCGCSGKNSSDITWRHVYVNAGLAVLAALVSVWAVQPLTVTAGWGLAASPVVSTNGALAILMAAFSLAVLALLAGEAFNVRQAVAALPQPPGHPVPPATDLAPAIREVNR